MADDLGYGDLGCYGSQSIHTPHLDRMASEGIRFTETYVGSPVCAPTRCSLMTGLHSGHITRRDNRSGDDKDKPFMQRKLIPLSQSDLTVATLLKRGGYATGGVGKWGLGNPGSTGTPDQHGFDFFYGYLDQVHAHSYYPSFLMRNLDTIPIPENERSDSIYTPDLMLNAAKSFIRQNVERPFFLYLPFNLPHGRFEIPGQGMYRDSAWSNQLKNYAAMITRMDRDIGQLFTLLQELNLDEQTITFFTSDNGPTQPFINAINSNGVFRGNKRSLLEGGIRTLMIVRWPGHIQAASESDFSWAYWDVLPTLLDLAGIPCPQMVDGLSVLPTLQGGKQAPKEFLYWEFYSPFHQAVRLGRWKGIRTGTEEPIHLFDLTKDMMELEDLAQAHPEVVSKMTSIMQKEHRDSPYWPPEKQSSQAKDRWLFVEQN